VEDSRLAEDNLAEGTAVGEGTVVAAGTAAVEDTAAAGDNLMLQEQGQEGTVAAVVFLPHQDWWSQEDTAAEEHRIAAGVGHRSSYRDILTSSSSEYSTSKQQHW